MIIAARANTCHKRDPRVKSSLAMCTHARASTQSIAPSSLFIPDRPSLTTLTLYVSMHAWISLLALASPWKSSEWRLNLQFGDSSSSTLALPCQVLIESEPSTELDEFMLGSFKSDCVSVLEDASYITMSGEQTVKYGDGGGWRVLTRRTSKAGDAGELRMWIDLQSDLSKNDFKLNAQRIYLTANCWRQEEFKKGVKRLQPLQQDFQDYQRQIQERLTHETGDRRLDGTNLVDTAMGSIDMGILVTKRDEARFRLSQAEKTLPNADSCTSGAWPGSTEPLYIAKGRIEVKESQLLSEGYRSVGTWTATPVANNDEYEYVYYEEDEEEERRVSDT